jgi:hypothetical protein
MPDCTTCKHFETFKPRADEPSGLGCRGLGFEGYVLDPKTPPCAGVRTFEGSSFREARLIRYAAKST